MPLFKLLPFLFSVTLFLSAGLLFLVEPMIAKMILPLLGGTPAVWNTCMMFFQAVLLAGYGYAHLVSTRVSVSRQFLLHGLIFAAGCLVLPIAVSRQWLPSSEGSPLVYVLLLLVISVGLPFFVLSSNALLLQKWFADTGHPSARDPYFLYSASNLGSMLALLSYPTLVEPYFRLAEQSSLWTIGYVVLLFCIAFCAWLTWKCRSACLQNSQEAEQPGAEACAPDDSRLTWRERCWWVLLALVPSSLMLGVTTFLSTDVAAIPLFWIIPLSLYLLSFIIVFARVPALVHRAMVLLLPLSIIGLIMVNFSDLDIPKWVIFACHLVNFFVFCMVCHGEIAGSRPTTKHLTEFYLLISVGGVLGGIFNALIAPVTFNTLLEYPLVLILGALLLPVRHGNFPVRGKKWREAILYAGTLILFAALTYWATKGWPIQKIDLSWLANLVSLERKEINQLLTYGLLGLLCYGLVFLKRPGLFGTGIAALLMTIVVAEDLNRTIVHRERSFFGVLTVTRDADGRFMNLSHGTTLHGMQWLEMEQRYEPVAYYHRMGPAGQVFFEFRGERKKARLAVIGLGAGTMAAYAGPGQELDYYEIDPAVKKISTNPAYFSYLSTCQAKWRIILGDGRLTMEQAPPHHYGIIVLDAFSSDAIPVHLLTKEAIKLYFSKLETDGLLLMHISNKYVNLAPVLANLAHEEGYAIRLCGDDGDDDIGKFGSTWVIIGRNESDFGTLPWKEGWETIERKETVKVWTDDFSNLLSVFKW